MGFVVDIVLLKSNMFVACFTFSILILRGERLFKILLLSFNFFICFGVSKVKVIYCLEKKERANYSEEEEEEEEEEKVLLSNMILIGVETYSLKL